jgi:hypothetical protein
MSTNSRIGIQDGDGSIRSVYCHWDGYPSANGKTLYEEYQDREKVMALIELGDLSALHGALVPAEGVAHSFFHPADGVCVAYHRDRQDDYSNPRHDDTLEEFSERGCHSYGYVYTKENQWMLFLENGRSMMLEEWYEDPDIVS